MKKKEAFRLFNFSDAKLVTIGKEKIAFMRRDAAEFEKYMITTSMLDELETAIDAFSDTDTDIEQVNDLKHTTHTKDLKAEELRVAIRGIMSHVVLVFEEGTPKYKRFGTEALSKQLDSDLLITAKRVMRMGTEFLGEIEPNGLTLEMLTSLLNIRNEFEDLIVDVKLKVGERDTQQQERVEKANAIYETMMKYTQTGISIWEASDAARCNDYIVYNTSSGEDEPDTAPLATV